jgi:diguanylate cyclase (GGDEF)-like protein/PAS domain S-box-containing protein
MTYESVMAAAEAPAEARADAPRSEDGRRILRRLIWPLAGALMLLAGVIASLLWRHQEQALQDNVASRIAEIPERLQIVQEQQLAVMSALLERITLDDGLRRALRDRDRARLLADSQALFEDLRSKYKISHFYFQDSERNNVLRVQFPEKLGGRIDRYTTLEAARTQKAAGGLELGSFGLLSLRVVHPVFFEGQLIGFVELGKEIDDVLQSLHEPGVEVAVALHKAALRRDAWEAGVNLRERRARWDDLPHDVLAYASLWPLPNDFLARTLGEHRAASTRDEQAGGRTWRSALTPLRDASGRDIGHLLVMLDISAQKAAFWRTAVTAGVISAVALGLLMAFLFRLLSRTEDRLHEQETKLHKTEALQRAIFDTVIDAIIVIDERGRIELVNPAFQEIFGYAFDEVRGRNVSMLMPEPYGAQHDGYMQRYLASGERRIIGIGREVLGQRKNGSIFPMDLAVSETLIDGRRLFTGLIRDVSARKQTETDLRLSIERQREYERHACVDALTGMHNRRWLEDTFARQVARCAQEGQALTLIMLDADHFKQYNDRHGHLAGDCALRALGRAIAENIRPNDLAARYGGEEFAVLLPDTTLEQALAVAERLRRAVERNDVFTSEGQTLPSITLSLGLAQMRDGDTLHTLLTAADAALYRAKAAGRNRVAL